MTLGFLPMRDVLSNRFLLQIRLHRCTIVFCCALGFQNEACAFLVLHNHK